MLLLININSILISDNQNVNYNYYTYTYSKNIISIIRTCVCIYLNIIYMQVIPKRLEA